MAGSIRISQGENRSNAAARLKTIPTTVLLIVNDKERIPALDGIRGLAIISVLLFHCFHWGEHGFFVSKTARFLSALVSPGWAGVNLFFVLSGFLITGILCQTRSNEHYYRNFYAKRALRILPLYWATLGLMVLSHEKWSYLIKSFLFLANIPFPFTEGGTNPSIWSLSVEEQFYLIWPFLVYRLSPKQMLQLTASICLLLPLARFIYGSPDFATLTWFRLDSFGWGALLALAFRFKKPEGVAGKIALSAFSLCAAIVLLGFPFGIISRSGPTGIALQMTAIDLFCLGLLALPFSQSSFGNAARSVLQISVLRRFGTWSYFLYLVHLPLLWFLDKQITPFQTYFENYSFLGAEAVSGFMTIVVGCLLAALSHRYFEKPILDLKRYL